MKNHTYYSDTEQLLSRATHFSHLKPPSLFPALFISNKYSLRFPPLSFFFRAFRRLQIFPRFRPVAAFKDSHMFSRAFYLTRFGFELWLANTAACKASMDINFSDFAGVTLILITV